MSETRIPDLDRLIGRVEESTGPDRELDCFIWAGVAGWKAEYDGNNRLLARKGEGMGRTLGFIDREERPGSFIPMFDGQSVPPYTASVDAAIALSERAATLPNHANDVECVMRDAVDAILYAGWTPSKPYGPQLARHVVLEVLRSLKAEESRNG